MTRLSKQLSLWRIYWIACRPHTLGASVCPILIGIGLAARLGQAYVWICLFAFITAVLLQIACNLANDYYDCLNGCDTKDRKGPPRVCSQGLIALPVMKRAIITCFSLAILFGLPLIIRGGMPFLIIGLVAILAALLYTGGPMPYGYFGLGDLCVFIFFGPVAVCGTVYLNTLAWSPYVFLISLSPGLLSMALLAINNLRDRHEDRVTQKYTLAVLLGSGFTKLEITLCIMTASLIPTAACMYYRNFPFTILTLLLLFLAKRSLVLVWKGSHADLNDALIRTAKLLISFTLLYGTGLFVS